MSIYLGPIVNILNTDDSVITILLGFSKYICKGFSKNNIQVTGNWYLEEDESILLSITDAIDKYNFKEVNFIGISKSCTGGFIFSSILSEKYPNVHFRNFAFSAYTRLDKSFYETNNLLDKVPPSLVKIWNNDAYFDKLSKNFDAVNLMENKNNIFTYLLYPAPSRGPEPLMVQRMEGLDNVCSIPLEVRLHGILYPFWKTISKDSTVEAFEGKVITLPEKVYQYFYEMQTYSAYKFDLYSLIYDTDTFILNMRVFNKKFQ